MRSSRMSASGSCHRAWTTVPPSSRCGRRRCERQEPRQGFLLCLGTDFRHKNRVFALRLLAALREDHDWQGSLVLAGTHIPVGSSLELERAFLEEHRELREAVVTLGSVSEQEKAWLMGHAASSRLSVCL